jgi:ABC-2 type transport system permease protein
MRHSVELTLARLAARKILGRRRALRALELAAIPILLAAVMSAEAGADPKETLDDAAGLFQALIVSVLLPVVALVVGTSVFGAEVDDGTITYVLGKPVPRWRIVLVRIVVAALLTAAVLVPTTLLSMSIALGNVDAPGVVTGFSVAVAAGSLLYCALFVALSLSTRRALVAGLAYVVVWEGLLSNTFGGSRALSIRQYTLSIADGLASIKGNDLSRLNVNTALIMASVVAVLVTMYAIRRLQRLEIGEVA